jgi:hypothetical protein
MTSLIVLTALALGASAPEGPEPLVWEAWAGLTTGLRPQTGSSSATGRIALSRKVGRRLRPELELGTGAHLDDGQTVSLMRLGARLELGGTTLVPWLYGGFAHHHEMSYEDARRAPWGAALGLSENGEIHRSGLDFGLGATLNLPRPQRDPRQLRLVGRASVLHLLGTGPARTVDVLLALAVGF